MKNNIDLYNNKKSYRIEEEIKEFVYNKIYNVLPQDIIFILPKNNIIKKKYYENKLVYNLKDYINKDDNKKFKISIIYTFTYISTKVEGLNNEMSFMISEINSENGLRNVIDEIKIKNENNNLKKEYIIYIHFDRSNSNKLKYMSNFILKNFKDDKFNYIFIIHIKRKFKGQKVDEIYSLPDIYDDINQLFIDNLNSNNLIKISDKLENNIKEMLHKMSNKLNEQFNKILIKFLYQKL